MGARLNLSPLQLDALREVGNVGAGRAATALSDLLGQPVHINVPTVSILPIENLPDPLGGPDALVAATYFQVEGDAPGRMLLLLTQESLPHILALLTGKAAEAGAPLDEHGRSAIMEMANILCGHYLNALSELLKIRMVPSVPALALDMVHSVLQSVLTDAAQEDQRALLIENQFQEAQRPVALYLFYIPKAGSLQHVLSLLENATGTDLGL